MSMLRDRWLQLFVLSILGLTFLAAGCMWIGLQLKWINDRHAALEWLKGMDRPYREPNGWAVYPSERRVDPPLSLRFFGERGVPQIYLQRITDGDFSKAYLEELFPEAVIEQPSADSERATDLNQVDRLNSAKSK